MRRTTKTESIEDHDAEFAAYEDDPWITVRRALNVVSLREDMDVAVDYAGDDTGESPERDLRDATRALGNAIDALTEQEQRVIIQRSLGNTYADIAELCEPPLGGPSQARKIEQRAMKKLRDRLSKFRKIFAKNDGTT